MENVARKSKIDMKKIIRPCRFCQTPLEETVIDLGASPIANALLSRQQLSQPESFFPLEVFLCGSCYLVQIEEVESLGQIFNDEYVYFSSFSDSWLKHAELYAHRAIETFGLKNDSRVIEVASNDGYLLQYFKNRGVPVLGIEPCGGVAAAAEKIGIPTLRKFFGKNTARELYDNGQLADLLIGNNVLAHVPDLNDFVAGMKTILKQTGVITMEFPHLLNLIKGMQFDTIYHEHFSYFSFKAVSRVFRNHGLSIFDVEQISTHGGSLRIFATHVGGERDKTHGRVAELTEIENRAKLENVDTYREFRSQVLKTKLSLLECLVSLKQKGKRIAGYGAPAKGNTLLNYYGIKSDFLDFTVDKNPHKQNKFLPGSHIPILPVAAVTQQKPDYLLILPWNLREEIVTQMSYIREWGGKFIIPIPTAEIIP
jgi:SAM-dependent methyltransferase